MPKTTVLPGCDMLVRCVWRTPTTADLSVSIFNQVGTHLRGTTVQVKADLRCLDDEDLVWTVAEVLRKRLSEWQPTLF